MTTRPRRRWPRFSLRTLFVALTLAGLASAYVGSYYRLARRGMQEARVYDYAGFFYVPFDEVATTGDLTQHYRRAVFYAPLNWLDRALLGNDGPIAGITWHLE